MLIFFGLAHKALLLFMAEVYVGRGALSKLSYIAVARELKKIKNDFKTHKRNIEIKLV